MMAFRTSTDAVDFALAFLMDTGVDHIGIRVGINSGQVHLRENDIYGLKRQFHFPSTACIRKGGDSSQQFRYEGLPENPRSRFTCSVPSSRSGPQEFRQRDPLLYVRSRL